MKDDEARRFFDAIAPRYDRAYAMPSDLSRARMARVLAELSPNSRVLDLGVGTGRELSALLDAGHSPIGLDFSTEMLALCNRRARPIPTVLASFWDPLPFADHSFDAVLALHGSLAHPPDDRALLDLGSEIARVLVRGGVIVVEAPSRAWLDTFDALDDGGGVSSVDRRIRKIAVDRLAYEDTVCNVRIEARVLDDDAWRTCFGPGVDVEIEALGPFERLVAGRRMR